MGIREARGIAPPHHMWYEAKIHQITAAELRAQDKEDVEGLLLLARSLQVRLCITYERGNRCDPPTD